MPDVLTDDDLNVLAAEYVLGTLDHEERRGASALLEVDPAFGDMVSIWERRLGELHLMVEALQPDPMIWESIRPKVGILEQIPPAIPSDPLAPLDEDGRPIPREPAPLEQASAPPHPASAPEPAHSQAEPEGPAEAVAVAGEQARPEETPAEETPKEGMPAEGTPKEGMPAEGTPAEAVPSAAADASPPEVQTLESAGDEARQPSPEPAQNAFVPPPPMVLRSAPPVVPPRRSGGGGWIATSLLMGVMALLLAALIGAWRFFPERLPERLRVDAVLNRPPSAVATAPVTPAPPPPPARPQPPAPFDE